MGHSSLAKTIAKAPCLRFPEPWGVSQGVWVTSFWLMNLLLFAPLIAIQKLGQKYFKLHNLKLSSSHPSGQKPALLCSWHSATLSQLLFPGQTASAMCHCMPSAHFQPTTCWGFETGSKRVCGSHVEPPAWWSKGLEFCPKWVYISKRWETHYPCSPAWTDMLTGTHSHALCLGECSVPRLLHRERFQYPHPLPHTAEITSPLVLMSHTAAELPEEQVHSWAGCKGTSTSRTHSCRPVVTGSAVCLCSVTG